MKLQASIFGMTSAVLLTACASLPGGTSVAEYCADASNADESVCQLKLDIDGNTTAIADTNMSLREARAIAERAMSAANAAQVSADRANSLAAEAMQRANSALGKMDNLTCETRTIQKTNIGTCESGYTLTSCTQSRYTTRSGGPSILREIDDKQCRFHDRVLEMKVRCCKTVTSSASSSVPVPLRRY